MRKITRQAVVLIEMFEGTRYESYQDSAGHWTIGIGHLILKSEREKYAGQILTDAEVFQLLQKDLIRIMGRVDAAVTVPLTDNQFSALVAWTFNLGSGALKRSNLLRRLNALDYAGAAGEFHRWTKVTINGQKVERKGLVRRRAAEELIFRSPDVVWEPDHDVWAGQADDPEVSKFIEGHPGTVVVLVGATVKEALDGSSAGDSESNGERTG